MTPYHARYYAMLLTRRASHKNIERYLPAIMSANIDIHPHQIDAALFASRSQYRDGVILADEEGLGKTVEAGIALLQASIENRNRLLVLCPPNLLVHWKAELGEKFSLECIALSELETRKGVVLLSYADAYKNATPLSAVRWDLCVLDEAHQLANAGLTDRVMSNAIRAALIGCPKLLLTATPMQNSLLDLYYLVRFVDETAFGSDPEVFRAKYMGNKPLKQELAARAQMICQRTLKRQALTMQLPRRIVHTILVPPSPEEDALSKRMPLYFHREPLLAFPKIQEHYIRLTYWKLLASSPDALVYALEKPIKRLENMPDATDELADLREVRDIAASIKKSARSIAFLAALKEAMRKLKEAGAPQKAVIFSENRRTIAYLYDLLGQHGYKDKVAIHSGGEAGEKALAAFQSKASILLATDSLGLGVNLTCCACVFNYDLPYNVQKLEQRISRCHRYGQKHEVIVLNFLDPANRADKRLYTLLNKKLKAFDDIFGASETVLGNVGASGAGSIPDARTEDEIKAELARFEQENRGEIERRTQKAAADLLAHFDDEVAARFKQYGETLPEALSQMEHWLWEITKYKLHNKANFQDDKRVIIIHQSPYKGFRLSRPLGMDRSLARGERYRLDHPLAKRVLDDCLDGEFSTGTLTLKSGGNFRPGMSGEMALWSFHIMTGTEYRSHPVLCGYVNGGGALSHEDCANLMKLTPLSSAGGAVYKDEDDEWMTRPGEADDKLASLRDDAFAALRESTALEQDEALSEELNKLRRWAEDEQAALTIRQREMAAELDRMKEQTAGTTDFAERFRLNKELAELEKARRAEEDRLFYLGAEIQQKRDALMDEARGKCTARFWDSLLFVVKWSVM